MNKLCNAEYPLQVVKLCRFGTHRKGKMYCRCPKKCATCVAGSTEIRMHPDLFLEYVKHKTVKEND